MKKPSKQPPIPVAPLPLPPPRAKKANKKKQFSFPTWQTMTLQEVDHFRDVLPRDAILMSRTGSAHGFEFLRFGERWDQEEKDPGTPVAQITHAGVQLLTMSDRQKQWIRAASKDNRRWEARRKLVRRHNFTRWVDLSDENHQYLLSLLWLPAEPLTAMEIIARMADS